MEFAPRCAADLVRPIERNRRCSLSYIEDFAIEVEPKMRDRWDAKTRSCFFADPQAKGGGMRLATEMIEVVCSRCGEFYREWYRPVLESATPSICPYCGRDNAADPILHENGVWAVAPADEARDR